MKLLVIMLLSSCAVFMPKPFNPKFISEYYVEECLDLCTQNPDVYLELISRSNLIYACHCKESLQP